MVSRQSGHRNGRAWHASAADRLFDATWIADVAREMIWVAVRCENAVLQNLELVSKLLGQLIHRSEIVTKSFLVTPDYLRFRSILIEELRGYPELAARIASRIATIESDVAEQIASKAKPPLIEARPL